MFVKPVAYRSPAQIKREFKDVSVWWISRRRLAAMPPLQYERLKSLSASYGVTRVIAAKVDLAKLSEAEIEGCVKDRLIMSGRVLDLRGAEKRKSLVRKVLGFFYFKLLQGVYSIKVRFTKADINLTHFHNKYGEKIVAILDFPEGDLKGREIPWVIIPPAFGKRKETYFLLALFLKKNGFGVMRYDDSRSVGESDGEIRDLTLSRSTENILATIDFLSRAVNAKRIGLIPFSLSARPAIRAAAHDKRVNFLLPIVGSPSVQSLLDRVYGEDLVADYAAGMEKGMLNLLGHFIDSSNFLGDAQKNGFADLATTKTDMEKIEIPIAWFCGAADPWVDPHEVREVLSVNPKGVQHDLRIFPDLTHRFREADKAQEIFAQVVRAAVELAGGRQVKEIVRPWSGEILEKAFLERKRIQTQISEDDKVRLWTNYLEGFGILKETDDYMRYLDDLVGKIDFKPGEKLLDAGSGNGYVVEYLLSRMINAVLEGKLRGKKEGQIIGTDIVPNALREAENMTSKVKVKLRDLPEVEFIEHDIDKGKIPFEDWHFDKVVASLLLSYLSNPQEAVRELCRVLRPGGTIVLTSLKPDADVSLIWDRFMKKMEKEYSGDILKDRMGKGREQFFRAVGWIENKEEEGVFRYFSPSELRDMLKENGIVNIEVIRSFGNQAVIVVGRKAP